ncbi:hypothetical protein TrRE_jg6831 [Triparma retinervis]|uniref:Transmembrane protein n=1 Tax=Triparma retinervis TaxID=2557542 RepID=A0A9W7A168_9STRA|nr:hypothetical protein TrRE_jg6831 [Triparma retinervis]
MSATGCMFPFVIPCNQAACRAQARNGKGWAKFCCPLGVLLMIIGFIVIVTTNETPVDSTDDPSEEGTDEEGTGYTMLGIGGMATVLGAWGAVMYVICYTCGDGDGTPSRRQVPHGSGATRATLPPVEPTAPLISEYERSGGVPVAYAVVV